MNEGGFHSTRPPILGAFVHIRSVLLSPLETTTFDTMQSPPITPPLTNRRVFKFWTPLAATWLMMSVEGPTLTAVIARMADPKVNLAAFGVAFAFALIVEAPVIMMMAASTALVRDRRTYLKLRNFNVALNIGITVSMLAGLVPSVHRWVSRTVLGLSPEVADLTWPALALLLAWPAAIGIRRFYQGILIRNGQTRKVAYGTVVRLSTMATATITLAVFSQLPGAAVGAGALSIGVTVEAIASFFFARPLVRRLLDGRLAEPLRNDIGLRYRSIAVFYSPLALTSFIALGVQPIVTFSVGFARAPLESLAVLPVVYALVFIFRAFGLAFQEVAIALFGEQLEGYVVLRRFAAILALVVASALGLIAWTPLCALWFSQVSGLSPELTAFAVTPVRVLFFMPALTVLISFQRALAVQLNATSYVTWASALEVLGVVTGLAVSILLFDLEGAVAAAAALMLGRLAANAYLIPRLRSLVKKIRAE